MNVAVSLGMITVLFAMTFKFVPDVKIAWKDVWLGAGLTAILFTVGKAGIGAYLGRSSMASSYGAAGSLVVLLVWVYYSAQIVFFGAEFTQVYANRFGSRVVPAENAIPVTGETRAQQGMAGPQSGLDPAVMKYFEAWNRGDALAVAATLSPSAIYRDPTLPPAGVGVPDFLSLVEQTMALMPNLRQELKAVTVGSGGRVAVETEMYGRPTDAQLQSERDVPFAAKSCLVFVVSEGLLQSIDAYFDRASLKAGSHY